MGRMNKQFESIEGTGLFSKFSTNRYQHIISTFNPQGQPNGPTLTYLPDDKYKITNCKDGEEVKVIWQAKGFPKHIEYVEEMPLPNDENGLKYLLNTR